MLWRIHWVLSFCYRLSCNKKLQALIYCWKLDADFRSDEGRDQSANDQTDLVLLFFRSLAEALGIPIAFPNSQFDCRLLDWATGASVLRSNLLFSKVLIVGTSYVSTPINVDSVVVPRLQDPEFFWCRRPLDKHCQISKVLVCLTL